MKTVIRPKTEMKDSGVEWIKYIPQNWNSMPLKRYFQFGKGLPITKADLIENGEKVISYGQIHAKFNTGVSVDDRLIRFVSSEYKSTNSNSLCSKGDIILADTSEDKEGCGNAVYIDCDEKIFAGYHTIILKSTKDNKYLAYLFQSDSWRTQIQTRVNGVKLFSITQKILNQCTIILPPLSEQQVIADYLDETCSQIDEIIAEAKASIDEYEKLKQATIDENILGYDSVHIKLRQLGSLKNGLNFSHSDDVANIKFLGVGCFKDNMILSEVDDFTDEHIDFEISEEYLLSNGDIVFVRSNGSKELVGRSIMVENIDYPVTFSGFCIRFRNMHTELVDNRFLLYYFRTTHFKQSLLKYSNDSTNINNLNQEMLNAIRINAPVIGEQKLLVKKLEEQVLMIDSLITEKESLINALEAYKKSLIYEVVTGKRRVV